MNKCLRLSKYVSRVLWRHSTVSLDGSVGGSDVGDRSTNKQQISPTSTNVKWVLELPT